MNQKVVFVSGAFTADTPWLVTQNVRAAEVAGLDVARLGAMPLIPHSNTANFDGELTGTFWIKGYLELLRRCDAVYVFNLRDLIYSKGTKGEVAEAEKLKIPVFYQKATLAEWLSKG